MRRASWSFATPLLIAPVAACQTLLGVSDVPVPIDGGSQVLPSNADAAPIDSEAGSPDSTPSAVCSPGCTGATPFCLAGSCVACDPSSPPQCAGTTEVQTCTDAGNLSVADCNQPTPSCVNGSCSCTTQNQSNGTCCPTGQIGCSGTCVDPSTDNSNCGGCGLTCGHCSTGECLVTMQMVHYGQFLNSFAVDSSNAYYTHSDTSGAGISILPLDGGTETVVETGAEEEEGLVVSTVAGIYFAVDIFNPGGVAGDEICLLNPAQGDYSFVATTSCGLVTAIAANSSGDVFWINPCVAPDGVLYRASGLDAGAGSPLVYEVTATDGGGIATSGNTVYYANGSTIDSISSTGGGITPVASNQNSLGFMAVEPLQGTQSLYWTTQGENLFSYPLAGGTQTTVISGQTFHYSAINSDFFYWATGTEILKVPLTGSASPTLMYTAASGDTLVGIGVSGNSVYWIESGASDYTLRKMTPN